MLAGDYQNSLRIESTVPVVAERPMYFNYQGTIGWNWTGGHCAMGVSSIDSHYYLAEGTSRTGFEEWITMQNPHANPITANVDYLLGIGEVVSRSYDIGAGKRYAVFLPNEAGYGQAVSAMVSSDQPIIWERPMYFDFQGKWNGEHDVMRYVYNAP